MQRRSWHVDFGFGLIMAALFGLAYHFDGPRDEANSIKPITTREDHKLLCADGQSPQNWICPEGRRL